MLIDRTSFPLAICLAVLLGLILPLWISLAITRADLSDSTFESRYSPLMEGVKPHKLTLLLSNLYFMLRRALLAVVLVTLASYPSLQCLSMALLSTGNSLLLVSLWPYETPADNWLELFNETCVFLCALSYLAQTDANHSYSLKTKAGWALVGITLFSFFVNGVISLAGVLYQIYRRIRRFIEHKKHLETIKIAAIMEAEREETTREI